jgi:hypothetical protein
MTRGAVTGIIHSFSLQTKAGSKFQDFYFEICFVPLISTKRGEFVVERDHDPPADGAASFHTTRWTIVMRAAQS